MITCPKCSKERKKMNRQNNIELTGYPSVDKPWLKYYSEKAINAPLRGCTRSISIFGRTKRNFLILQSIILKGVCLLSVSSSSPSF